MSFEFFGVIFGLGKDNEIIVSVSYGRKKRTYSKLMNFSLTTNTFTFWEEKEKRKDKISKDFLAFLEKEKFEEKAVFFLNEFKKMKNICDHKNITWFKEGLIPENSSEECFYFKANSLNEQTKVMMIPKYGNGYIVNERYPELEFVFTWHEALTETEMATFFPAITYSSKNRIRLLFELRQNKNV